MPGGEECKQRGLEPQTRWKVLSVLPVGEESKQRGMEQQI
jgi:hypothetical protein